VNLKIILCGQRSFGAAVYRELAKTDHEIAAVYAPIGDKLHSHASLCGEDVRESGTLRSETMPKDCDIIVAAHSHDFVSRAVRNNLRVGAIGYHPSLLPRHKGRDSVAWTIKMGDPVCGGSVYWLNDSVDGGPIAKQDWRWVLPNDTAKELWRRELFPLGVKMLISVVGDIAGGSAIMIDQQEGAETWEPSLSGAPRLHRPELMQIGASAKGMTVFKD
jgi:methionyl-tRNA formyltransferase